MNACYELLFGSSVCSWKLRFDALNYTLFLFWINDCVLFLNTDILSTFFLFLKLSFV